MTFAVVDYERMKRLQPPPRDIKFDLNTVSVIVIIIMAMYLYKRYVTVKQSRELYHVWDIQQSPKIHPSSSSS